MQCSTNRFLTTHTAACCVPGVIESKSNFIEHPELIAQRIAHYAKLVGGENVIAGSDSGFGTWVG